MTTCRARVLVMLSVARLLWPEPASARGSPQSLRGSLETPYSYSVWTTEDGLPQNSITAMVRTRDGYLWLATFGGLARFDGVEFLVLDLANHPGLLSNRIKSLHEDRRGALWLGLEREGLARYSDGRFTSYDRDDGLPLGSVLALTEDAGGDLWIGTEGGLARLRDDHLSTYGEDDGLPSRHILSLLTDRQGVLWIGTAAGLARRTDGGATAFAADSGWPPTEVYSLLEDSDGGLWLDTGAGFMRHFAGRFHTYLERSQPMQQARPLALTQRGQFWSGPATIPDLHCFSRPDRVAPDPVRAETVTLPRSPVILSLLADREDNLWVGTAGKGLFRLRVQPVQLFTREDGLPADDVRAITADGRGGLWLAFDCNATSPLTRWHDGTATYYPTDQNGQALSCVSSLLRARDGSLWLAAGGDLVHYQAGAFERFTLLDVHDEVAINAIFEDRDGVLWIGLLDHGLARFDQGDWVTYTRRDGLVNDSVHFITQDREGTLWIGTNSGLSRFRDGIFESFTTDDGLPPGMVRSIYEDAAGTFWIGTYGGGLSRFSDGVFTRYGLDDGLAENVVSRILEDERDNLWMLGNQGLFFVNRKDLNAFADGEADSVVSVTLGRAEGMTEGSGGRQPAGWRTEDGKMWFPTIDGLAVVDARSFRRNTIPPPVTIQRLLAGGQSVDPRPTIELAAGVRDLEIHYTGLSFAAPEKVRFRYLLEGYEKQWQEVGGRRVAYYTHLPPGTYTFRVTAANPHVVWNERGAKLALVIPPFFYETPWFWLLCSLSVVVLSYSAYRARLRAAHLRNARLQKEIDERRRIEAERELFVTELEHKNAELERFNYTVSHDLKSPLVTIKGFLGLLRQDAARGDHERMEADIGRISGAADKMSRLLGDLLELSRVGYLINPRQAVALDELVREAVELVTESLAEHHVEVEIAPDLPVVRGDRVQLLEVFRNLLENAVQFMGNQPAPHIAVGERPGDPAMVCCTVRDNGIGIDPRYNEKVFGLFERLDAKSAGTGIGLALVKRIVELHGGRIWVESEGRERGSTFCFLLPRDA
jgi:ligand-binding sensor domain-containing protein/signal transduction histidine kinase